MYGNVSKYICVSMHTEHSTDFCKKILETFPFDVGSKYEFWIPSCFLCLRYTDKEHTPIARNLSLGFWRPSMR